MRVMLPRLKETLVHSAPLVLCNSECSELISRTVGMSISRSGQLRAGHQVVHSTMCDTVIVACSLYYLVAIKKDSDANC